ncbi:MAG: HAMP domain-containing sensor histidine kinase, partial [Sulfurimonas sp.]|nr:HAMP domain-containing sensor histidine kinase [Sulfurimonas sp.]
IWTFNLVSFGLMWDIFFLSFAIAYRIRLLQEENIKNERLAMMKFRETTIGELSGNIAHQWRQPLAELGSISANIEAKLKYGEIQKEELLEQISLSTTILKHLSETVNTFSKFFQNLKTNEKFSVQEEIQRCVDFIADSMQHNGIEIIFSEKTDVFLTGHANEFAQVILNILLNAKDILIEREIQKRYIKIEMKQHANNFTIFISDNGGGVNIKPIKSIFESYVTDKQNGTGIGLFMAKTILTQKFNAKIKVYNNKNGAVFELSF